MDKEKKEYILALCSLHFGSEEKGYQLSVQPGQIVNWNIGPSNSARVDHLKGVKFAPNLCSRA